MRILTLVGLLLMPAFVYAEAIVFSDFRDVYLFSGPNRIVSAAINTAGDIAGSTFNSSLNPSPYIRGFLLPAGSAALTPLQLPGSTYTYAEGINDSGTVVGYSLVAGIPNNKLVAYTENLGRYTTLNTGYDFTLAQAINNKGDVAGAYSARGSSGTGFILTKDGFTSFSVPGAPLSTYVTGLNDTGTAVGYYIDPSGKLAGFMRDTNGAFTYLDFIPGSINNAGLIVGGNTVYLNGTNSVFNLPSGLSQPASLFLFTGISNSNELTGYYSSLNSDTQHLFTATATVVPTPEPASFASALAGLLLLNVMLRWRKRQPLIL